MENYIKKNSIGLAWRNAIEKVFEKGKTVHDGEVKLHELLGLHITIDNPSEDDEFIKKNGDLSMIEWKKNNFFSDKNVLDWGYSYGQRLTNYEGINQIKNVKEKLLKNPESKSATICLNNPKGDEKHSPCINILDFKLRNDTLILNTFFRSQDICKKMYADTICLTEILNDMAETLKIKNTQLNLYIMSAHIYENDFKRGKELINE